VFFYSRMVFSITTMWWIPELSQNLIQMFLNFTQLLSIELSKEITMIYAIIYILFCNSYFYVEFLREN